MDSGAELAFDPAEGDDFWARLEQIPGYPAGVQRPIRRMVFEHDAIARLADLLEGLGSDRRVPLLIVMDRTPMRRGPDELKTLLLSLLTAGGWTCEPIWMEPDSSGQVHTELPRVGRIQDRIRPGRTVISVGSGTVTDLAKHACHRVTSERGHAVTYVAVQTANSVSAYASNMAPVFISGVKRTLPSRYPDALVCDLQVLRDAPWEMTAAGVGDLLAAFVSLPDWTLAHSLGMEPAFTELPLRMLGPLDEILLAQAEAIRSLSEGGMSTLAKLITLAGLVMSLSGTTAPMSGFEHVMSHVIDMAAERRGRALAPHGSQAALCAVVGSAVYQEFLDTFDPRSVVIEHCNPPPGQMRAHIADLFRTIDPSGSAASECWSDYREKLERWSQSRPLLETLVPQWRALRDRLRPLTRRPTRLLEILEAVGSPMRFEDLLPPVADDQVRFAFLAAPFIRRRLTLGDLLVFFEWDREALWRRVRSALPAFSRIPEAPRRS